MKIGIVGVGAMGGAIVSRLLQHTWKSQTDFQLVICELDLHKRQQFEDYDCVVATDKISNLNNCDMVIVAVKPKAVADVLTHIAGLDISIVVSIAAGISIAELTKISNKPVARVMPNTPCKIGEGISAVAFSEDVQAEERNKVKQLFAVLGEIVEVEERLFPVVTALSGCGPAYVYLMIEALIDAGCAHGLMRDTAKKLIVTTFIGSAKLLQESSLHPAVLKDQVTSPQGVTVQALHVLEQKGLRGILWDAVNQAVNSTKE
ncbi:MAG: pyrroline-5-carboxylate reductase [Firmicutes bacterium]|nr:pyrroline-5-carboxylate reductase [Bacillota bacterium]